MENKQTLSSSNPHELKMAACLLQYPNMVKSVGVAEQAYLELLRNGVRPQEARSVLPNALAATIAVTGNLRVIGDTSFLCDLQRNPPRFPQSSRSSLESFQNNIPLLFDDMKLDSGK